MIKPSSRGGAPSTPGLPRAATIAVLILIAGIVAVFLVAAVTARRTPTGPTPQNGSSAGPTASVQPVLPTAGAGSTRTPPPELDIIPAPGTVTIEPGAFTDRLQITNLSLLTADHPTVTGSLSNPVDVSPLIVLELRADFYDAAGNYIGFGTATYADQEFAGNGTTQLAHSTAKNGHSFEIAVRSGTPLSGAISAILTIPQLVNE